MSDSSESSLMVQETVAHISYLVRKGQIASTQTLPDVKVTSVKNKSGSNYTFPKDSSAKSSDSDSWVAEAAKAIVDIVVLVGGVLAIGAFAVAVFMLYPLLAGALIYMCWNIILPPIFPWFTDNALTYWNCFSIGLVLNILKVLLFSSSKSSSSSK
jgi:hypothetical protein